MPKPRHRSINRRVIKKCNGRRGLAASKDNCLQTSSQQLNIAAPWRKKVRKPNCWHNQLGAKIWFTDIISWYLKGVAISTLSRNALHSKLWRICISQRESIYVGPHSPKKEIGRWTSHHIHGSFKMRFLALKVTLMGSRLRGYICIRIIYFKKRHDLRWLFRKIFSGKVLVLIRWKKCLHAEKGFEKYYVTPFLHQLKQKKKLKKTSHSITNNADEFIKVKITEAVILQIPYKN